MNVDQRSERGPWVDVNGNLCDPEQLWQEDYERVLPAALTVVSEMLDSLGIPVEQQIPHLRTAEALLEQRHRMQVELMLAKLGERPTH